MAADGSSSVTMAKNEICRISLPATEERIHGDALSTALYRVHLKPFDSGTPWGRGSFNFVVVSLIPTEIFTRNLCQSLRLDELNT